MPLIVIDGIDGTGKATQSRMLAERLTSMGLTVKELDFPRYNEGSGILIKQYLAGKFGPDPKELSPYLISPMYMIDRLASYLEDWRADYERGDWLISNRYVSSNMIHQGAKLKGADQAEYVQWNYDVEHMSLGLPVPDKTILLEIPFTVSSKLRRDRGNVDIHEADSIFLYNSRITALSLAERFKWEIISCADENTMLSQEQVHEQIMDSLSALIQPAINTITAI